MTASMVMTVYAYPNFASSGLHLIFFLILGGIFWFLPVALVAAEMATVKGWEDGGIYAWVGNTLGKRWGFAALFYQWFQITVGFVTMAFFVLAAISYIVGWDALYNNPLVMFIGVAIIVWVLTLTQLGRHQAHRPHSQDRLLRRRADSRRRPSDRPGRVSGHGGVSQLHFERGRHRP